MKKLLSLLLCFAMVVGLLAGCGGGEKQNDTKENDDGKITLTIGLVENVLVEDYDTNAYTLWLEEQTGYNIEFVKYNGTAADVLSKISALINANRDLPDILWGINFGEVVYKDYGEAGYFLDLTEYFEDEEMSKVFWERFAQLDENQQATHLIRMKDMQTGAMYAFPRIESSMVDCIDYMTYINREWLKRLNLEMPTDPESLYNVLKAFKEQDANGNGDPNDEIPLVGSEESLAGDFVNWIVNMYVYADDTTVFNVDENGKLYVPFMTDEYREALKFINRLFAEGLVYRADTNIKGIITPSSGETVAGVFVAHTTGGTTVGNERLYEYEALPYWSRAVVNEGIYTYDTFITDSCENPDAAWELLMTMCTEEGSRRMRYGNYGIDWTDADPDTKSFLGRDAEMKVINEECYGYQNNSTWNLISGTILIDAENEVCQLTDDMDEWVKYKMQIFADCYNSYNEAREKYNPKNICPKLVYSLDEQNETEQVRSDCKRVITTNRTQFCEGLLDPNDDAQWNEYLNTLEQLGIQTWLEQAQGIYDRQMAELNK